MSQEFSSPPFDRRDAVVVGLLVLFGALLRIPGLEQLPPALWFDEGLNGVDALAIARGGPWHLVFREVFPREPMLIYPMALLIRLFGPETFTLRLASALVGTAAPPLLFLWLRKAVYFRAALFAALFLVGLRWHVHFSRIALRTIWTPTLAAAFFAALWMACSSQKRIWAVLSGIILGTGVYAYLSWYFFAPCAVIVSAVAFSRADRKRWLANMAILSASALIVALPMWIHYASTPSDATGRIGALSLFNDGASEGLQSLAKNARDASLMLVWKGDHVPKHNIPHWPALEPMGVILFLLGLAGAIATLRRSTLSLALILYLVFGTLPTVFSRTDSANFLRTLIITPAVAAFVGLGAESVALTLQRKWPGHSRIGIAIPSLLLAISIGSMFFLYFGTWADWPGLKGNFSGEADDIARFVRTVNDETPVLVPGALAQDSYTFRFLTADKPNVQSYTGGISGKIPRAPSFVLVESPFIDPKVAEDLSKYSYPGETIAQFSASSKEGETFVWARALRVSPQ